MTFAEVVAVVILATSTAALVLRLRSLARSARPPAPEGPRWESRPVLGTLVIAAAHLIPIVAAVVVPLVLARHMSRPSGWFRTAITWAILFSLSTAVVVVIGRIARRLLPLGALLKLSLAFPDRAPRRLAVARRAGAVRNLEVRLARARTMGVEDEPARAAETILTLVGALHAHDRRTRGHAERVRVFTDLLADEMGIAPEDRDRLRWAALLHDIGKVHVPAKILNKPGPPTQHEWDILRRHPIDGARLAAPLFSWLGDWSLTIAQHHERWDGTGYPYGLRGEEISYGARVVSVTDSFDAMTAARSYQRPRTAAAARREITQQAGRDFDPTVVRAFLNISVRRLQWVLGPLSWLGQAPLVRWLPQAAEGVMTAGSEVGGVIGTAAGAAVIATGGAIVASHPPASAAQPISARRAALAVEARTTPTSVATSRDGGGADGVRTAPSSAPTGVPSPGEVPPAVSLNPDTGAPATSPAPTASGPTDGSNVGPGSGDGSSVTGGGDSWTSPTAPTGSAPLSPSDGDGGVTTTTTTASTPMTTPTTVPPATTNTTVPPAITNTTVPPATTNTTVPPATTDTTLPLTANTTLPLTTDTTLPLTTDTTLPLITEVTLPPTTSTTLPVITDTTLPLTTDTTLPLTTDVTLPPTTSTTLPLATDPTTLLPLTTDTTLIPLTTDTTLVPLTTDTTIPAVTTPTVTTTTTVTTPTLTTSTTLPATTTLVPTTLSTTTTTVAPTILSTTTTTTTLNTETTVITTTTTTLDSTTALLDPLASTTGGSGTVRFV